MTFKKISVLKVSVAWFAFMVLVNMVLIPESFLNAVVSMFSAVVVVSVSLLVIFAIKSKEIREAIEESRKMVNDFQSATRDGREIIESLKELFRRAA